MLRFWSDFRYAVRSLRREPGFSAVAALTLALGIGSTTAIFTGIAAYQGGGWKAEGGDDVFLSGQGETQRLKAVRVSRNLFDVLGANPLMGRTFRDEEMFAGKNRVAVLSYGLWQSLFAGDPRVVGRHISLNSAEFEVRGDRTVCGPSPV